MKKSIAVIALDPFAGKAYAQQVRRVFGSRAIVRNYSIMDGTAESMESCDLYMGSTDAFDAMGGNRDAAGTESAAGFTDTLSAGRKVSKYLPGEAPRMEIQVTYRKESIRLLQEIPRGTKVLFVNMTEVMAREAVTQLEQLGVTHLKFIVYAPGMTLPEYPEIAVTPDEERFVPQEIDKVINIGQRTCSSDTMIEAAIRLGLDNLLEEDAFKQYQESVCTNTYYFDRMMNRSRRLESQFDILMEVLEQGIIAVDEHGEIYAINKKARNITHVFGDTSLHQQGEKVFPYIPFNKCLSDKTETEPQVVKIAGSSVSMHVRLVFRRKECIGAFAILQKFNEMERRQNELRGQLMKNNQGHRAKYCFDDVIGCSEPILKTKEILRKMAQTESPVLLIGETGTGKELFAHSVHNASKRKEQPFVAINCAAMPENLLESELFGYEEGAFTGAKKGGRPGLFEFAHQGTMFLDEVEGMSPALQVRLLRVLQEREIMRVGGNRIIHVDVRIVAATNEHLDRKVEDGSFRRDLYYRLNALPVLIPPLRMRGNDVFLLLDKFRKDLGGRFTLSEDIRRLFLTYYWHGNIRELRNIAEYLNFTGHSVITQEDLPPTFWMTVKETKKPEDIKADPTGDSGNIVNALTKTEQFILEMLYTAGREGKKIGRNGILAKAKDRGIPMTQPQVRAVIAGLVRMGFATTACGRGGTAITEKGISKLEHI